MRKFLIPFLLVTVAAVPTAAMAQRGDFAARGGERGLQRSGGDDNDGGWRGQRAQRSAPQPQVQQQAPARQAQSARPPSSEAQPQSSERRNWQRGAVRTPDTLNTSPTESRRWDGRRNGERRVDGRGDDPQRRYGWNRGANGQPVPPPAIAVPQQPRQDWTAEQRERWASRNRNTEDDRRGTKRRDGDRDRYEHDRRDRDGRRYAYRSPNGRDDSNWHNRSWYNNDGRFDRWNNDWRRDRRYDWRGYRAYNRDFYRLPRYSHPYGYNYGYRRFSVGIFLDNLFYSDRYWINDPFEYRLPPAYGPYRWVRYFDDVMLVDLRNGRVVDVIYRFFY